MLINDLSAKVEYHRSIIDCAIARVLDRSWLVLGPEVKTFEEVFASYTGTSSCCSLANGTDALELGLRAAGVRQGDTVATVANAGFYTATALLAIDAEPYYLDVNIDSRVVTQVEVERAISSGVNAVVVTHLYGQAVPEIKTISALCRTAGVALVEDCAQAHGARIDGQHVGSFGDVGCFSFYPTKNLGAMGDGGAVVTSNPELYENVSRLRQYGWSGKYQVEMGGGCNSRLDEVQAAILIEFLPELDSWNARRREIAAIYSTRINNHSVTVPPIGDESYVAHLYVIRVQQRSDLQSHLRSLDIASDIHYPIPDTQQAVFGDRYVSVSLPNTESLSRDILTLPCYPEMTDDQVQQVVAGINGWRP